MPQEIINIPLVLSSDQRGIDAYSELFTNANDQHRINALYEITRGANGAEPTANLTRRPGISRHADTFGAGTQTQYLAMSDPAAAWASFSPWVAVKDGTANKVVNSATAVTVLTDADYVARFWDNVRLSGTNYCLLQLQNTASPDAATHSQKVFISSSILTWTQIADSASVFSALKHRGKMEEIDGYLFAANGKKINNSVVNNAQSWDATNVITITSTSDELQGLARRKRTILGFGRETVEAFEIPTPGNATGSVLNRVAGSVDRIGLGDIAGPGSLSGKTHYYTVINDLLFYVGRYGGIQGDHSLIVYDGQRHTKLSKEFEDKLLSNTTLYSVNRVSIQGKVAVAIQLTAPTASAQQALLFFPDVNDFFVATGQWSVVNNGYHYLGAGTSQNLFFWSNTNKWLDHSTSFTMSTQFKLPARDSEYKELIEFGVIGDTMRSSENLNVQFSKDDGQTWTTARTIDMSKVAKRIHGGPVFRELMVRLTHAGSNEVRLRRAVMKVL